MDAYIRGDPELLRKTTFFWVTFYAANIKYPWYMPFQIPNSDPNKVYAVWATPSWVPIKLIGDGTTNVGLYVKSILDKPHKTLPTKSVLATTDDMTAAEMTELWASVQGKHGVLLQVNKDTYYNMWPQWGKIMDMSHSYWEMMKEQSFSGEEGILTKDDLKVNGLIGTKAAFIALSHRV